MRMVETSARHSYDLRAMIVAAITAAVSDERTAALDDCAAEARDDGTAQRVAERIRQRARAQRGGAT